MTQVLRIYKTLIIGGLIFTISILSSLPTFAETINTRSIQTDYEIFEMEEDFMDDFRDLGDCVNVKVKIYNNDNQLVRCSSEKSEMIMGLLKNADFLADVGGVEFYRLNK